MSCLLVSQTNMQLSNYKKRGNGRSHLNCVHCLSVFSGSVLEWKRWTISWKELTLKLFHCLCTVFSMDVKGQGYFRLLITHHRASQNCNWFSIIRPLLFVQLPCRKQRWWRITYLPKKCMLCFMMQWLRSCWIVHVFCIA